MQQRFFSCALGLPELPRSLNRRLNRQVRELEPETEMALIDTDLTVEVGI